MTGLPRVDAITSYGLGAVEAGVVDAGAGAVLVVFCPVAVCGWPVERLRRCTGACGITFVGS